MNIYDMHFSIFILIIIALIFITAVVYKIKKNNKYTVYGIIIFETYILCLIKVVFLPIRYINKAESDLFLFDDISYTQLIPFKTLSDVINANTQLWQIGGNIILLIPFVFFCRYLFNKMSYAKLIAYGLCASLAIEIMQLMIDYMTNFPNKICDIDDVILNVIGVIIATFIIKLVKNTKIEDILKCLFKKDGAN